MTATSGPDRAVSSIDAALQLVDAVKRWDRRDVRAAMKGADLPALCVVLAAMVNDEATLPDLLGWTEQRDAGLDGWTWAEVLAAHSEYEQYRYRGMEDQVPDETREGQRIYDKVRARKRRADRAAA